MISFNLHLRVSGSLFTADYTKILLITKTIVENGQEFHVFCVVCFPPVSVQYSSQFLESHSITAFFCNPASLGLVFFFTFVYNDNGVHLKIVRREFL